MDLIGSRGIKPANSVVVAKKRNLIRTAD
jgi:hypothetical protein